MCDFGKWLNALSLADRMMKEWREVKSLHAKFHASAADVLASAVAGRKSEADTSMAPGGAFSDVSMKLVKEIIDWKMRVSAGVDH